MAMAARGAERTVDQAAANRVVGKEVLHVCLVAEVQDAVAP